MGKIYGLSASCWGRAAMHPSTSRTNYLCCWQAQRTAKLYPCCIFLQLPALSAFSGEVGTGAEQLPYCTKGDESCLGELWPAVWDVPGASSAGGLKKFAGKRPAALAAGQGLLQYPQQIVQYFGDTGRAWSSNFNDVSALPKGIFTAKEFRPWMWI